MTMIRVNAALATLLVLATLTACGAPHADRSYDPARAEAEIREIERTWAAVAVSGDPAAMEQIFADDFIGVSPDGTQYTKRGFIEDTKANPLGFKSNELNETKVRFIGSMAIAQGDETFTRQDGTQGRFVWTDVLERRDGRWQIVAAQDVIAPVAGQSASAPLFTSAAQPQHPEQEIAKTRNAYMAAWQAANAAAISQLYTDDAFVLYPDQPAVSGRSAIRRYFAGFFGDFKQSDFKLSSAEVVVAGPWAFDRGTYEWQAVDRKDGSAVVDKGKYLVILRQQGDGSWKLARDMDNSDGLAAQATRGTR